MGALRTLHSIENKTVSSIGVLNPISLRGSVQKGTCDSVGRGVRQPGQGLGVSLGRESVWNRRPWDTVGSP